MITILKACRKLLKRLKNTTNILFPLILTSVQRIDIISNAMDLRCFGKNKKRTWYVKRPFTKNDVIGLAIGIIVSILSIVVTYQNGSRYFNPFI